MWLMALLVNSNTLDEMFIVWRNICILLLSVNQNDHFKICSSLLSKMADQMNANSGTANFVLQNVTLNGKAQFTSNLDPEVSSKYQNKASYPSQHIRFYIFMKQLDILLPCYISIPLITWSSKIFSTFTSLSILHSCRTLSLSSLVWKLHYISENRIVPWKKINFSSHWRESDNQKTKKENTSEGFFSMMTVIVMYDFPLMMRFRLKMILSFSYLRFICMCM